jgi:uncharacterized membrane protein
MSNLKAYVHFSPLWYGVLMLFSALLFITSMGGGIFGLDSGHFYHKVSLLVFDSLCHQQEGRSLSIGGVPMAVCSRCFSIYGSFFVGLALFPLLLVLPIPYKKKLAINMIIVALALIVVDFFGNLAGFWMNSHQSRIILGALLGFSLAWLLAGEFKQQSNKFKHGTS